MQARVNNTSGDEQVMFPRQLRSTVVMGPLSYANVNNDWSYEATPSRNKLSKATAKELAEREAMDKQEK